MDPIIDAYLDPQFRFAVAQGPRKVRSRDDALTWGLNCIALAHLLLADLFGLQLPNNYRSTELSSDDVHFEELQWPTELATGDLIWFGTKQPAISLEEFIPRYAADGELLNFGEFPINHVGIVTGDQMHGEALVIHASPHDGTNAVWPLNRFADHDRYGSIYKVMRVRDAMRHRRHY